MRSGCTVLTIVLSGVVLGQSGVGVAGDSGSGFAGVRGSVRVEPPSPGPWVRRFNAASLTGAINSVCIYQRYLYDDENHVFLGYDLMLEPQPQNDTFRASFYELGMGVAELPMLDGKPRAAAGGWKKAPLAKYPAPQIVHTGDTISVELWTAPDSGQKIVDQVRIDTALAAEFKRPAAPPARFLAQIPLLQSQLAQMMRRGPLAGGAPGVPAVNGPARDFSAADAELQLVQPRVTINGALQDTGRSPDLATAKGSLIFVHLPGRGRYVLSLAARPELGFVKAGEIRGGAAQFTLEGERFDLETSVEIAPGSAAYVLYVLHDPAWEPTAQSQRGLFQVGSVSAGEIELLRRK